MNKIYTCTDLYNKLREFINLPKEAVSLDLKLINDDFPIINLTTYACYDDDDVIFNHDSFNTVDKKFAIIDFDDLELFKEFKKLEKQNVD